ncbi:glycosyltransferase [Streptomyces sp. TRM70308]|uniref:glycosyltransferase n=1 Tax=Streptomyces sp. TRM70308 TaxID=3131932 RepID=UPI003D000D28
MRIAFLLHNAYAIGGTTRTTLTLAGALAARHDVELVSVFRHRDEPQLGRAPGVALRALVDRREGSADLADPRVHQPGTLFPRAEPRAEQYHRLAEERIVQWLGETDAEVVVSARCGLNALLARFGPTHAVRVGQEHLTHGYHPHRLRTELQDAYVGLDALVTMTEADARAHRRGMWLPHTRVLALPNSVPEPGLPPADGTSRIIVAAGRLAPVKRYGKLVDAFARANAACPGWSLRIYGGGTERDRIAARVARHGLHNEVLLMGSAAPLEAEWVKGSVAAVSSSLESFGMTIVEAMRCGLPVVSTDCPHGPGEIIRDGVDGRLVPVHSTAALGDALLELMRDDARRTAMGRAAREGAAARFDPQRVAERYEELFAELADRDGREPTPPLAHVRGRLAVGRTSAGRYARRVARRADRSLRRTVRRVRP